MTLPSARRNRYLRVPMICEICIPHLFQRYILARVLQLLPEYLGKVCHIVKGRCQFFMHPLIDSAVWKWFLPRLHKGHAVPPASLILYPAFPYRTASLSPICTLGVFPVFIHCSVQLSFSFHHRDEKSITRMNARIELDVSLFQAVFLKINPGDDH